MHTGHTQELQDLRCLQAQQHNVLPVLRGSVSAHLAQEDACSGHQGGVNDIFRCQAVVIGVERRSAGVQLRQSGVLVQGLVPVVLRHPASQVVREADQQRPPQCVCVSLACGFKACRLQAVIIQGARAKPSLFDSHID